MCLRRVTDGNRKWNVALRVVGKMGIFRRCGDMKTTILVRSREMQIQPQEMLDRVDELWAIHTYGCDLEAEVQHGCRALIVDPRYVKCCGFESRLAVSFGRNPFSPEMVSGFVPPPYKPGEYLFGLHNVGLQGSQLSLFDMWMISEQSAEGVSAEYVLRTAERMLSRVSDEEYRRQCSDKGNVGTLERSAVWLLEQMEIVPIEHF